MPLKIEQRAGRANWYLRGTLKGIRVRESCGTDEREIAEALKTRREWEILQGDIFGHKATGTFLAGVAVYLEQDGEARYLQPLIDHFGATPINQIDQGAIDRAARVIYPHAANSTLDRAVYSPMSAVINKAATHNLCAPLKLKRPKLPKGRVRWITHAEADRLITASAPHLAPLMAFLFYTGARIGEAIWLDWKFVDLKRRQVQFLDTKNGTDRGVPLHPALVAILADVPHRTGNVFLDRDGNPYRPVPPDEKIDVSAGSRVYWWFKMACKAAGIEDFSPHDCRHTWATWHYMANRDLNLLMHLGGWKSLNMVLRYAHVNVAHAAPSIDNMPMIGPGSRATRDKKSAPTKRKARA